MGSDVSFILFLEFCVWCFVLRRGRGGGEWERGRDVLTWRRYVVTGQKPKEG